MSQPAPERRHVFISYSHADRLWVERLQRMMAPLLRATGQELRLWDDSQIAAGSQWRPAIKAALAEAKVALLLVSDAFLASEFVINEELPALLAAAEAEGVPILWASVAPCHVEVTEIYHYQAVLSPSRHLKAMDEVEWAEALKTISLAIRKAALAGVKPAAPQEVVAPPGPGRPQGPSAAEASATEAAAEAVPPLRAAPGEPAAPGSSAAPPLAAAAAPATTPPGPAERNPGARQPLAGRRLESARLVRSGGGWQVERREVEVRGCLVELGDGVSLPLIEVPAGELVMGSPGDEPDRQSSEGPMHRVRLEGFLIGQTPITQAQWRAVARQVPPLGQRWERELALNPSHFTGQADSDQRPVERVSWHDAMEFCRRLSALSGDAYKLPSEAQWEYACRAGTTTPFAFGETITTELANYDGNYSYAKGPKGEYRQQTTPVGMFAANGWGLQDMHGNVWEWCLDHWHGSYEGAPFDGSAWVSGGGPSRLLRGGSWGDYPRYCRSAHRSLNRPVNAYSVVGFRVVCLPQGPSLNP